MKTKKEKRPIICLAAIDWHFLFHRPHQLMLHFARRGHQVHYRNFTQIPGTPPQEVVPNLYVYRDFNRLPRDMQSPIYFVYFPAYASWLNAAPDSFIVYDCIDDDPAFDRHEELMLVKADLVLCVSKELMNKHKGKHPHVILLPNGVDIDHYSSKSEPGPEIIRLKEKAEAIIGFTGAFYHGWVDTDLVYFIARQFPQWQIVLVGESYRRVFSNAPPNISYLGKKPYEVLPGYIRCFDIGIIPFLDNRIARGADPVKIYEYMAAGIPIVSRNLPFVNDMSPPLIYSYNNENECVMALSNALEDEKKFRQDNSRKRSEFISGHTWENRMNRLVSELNKLTWLEN